VEVVREFATGTIDPAEAEVVRIHELEPSLARREAVQLRIEGTTDEWVHVDAYPAVGEARGIVAFVGGLSAHALLYGGFLAELSERAWNVVAFDVRGHGRSSGRRGSFTLGGMVDDFRHTIAWAQQRFGTELPMLSMGSSLGGFYSQVASNAIPEIQAAVCHSMLLPELPVTSKDRRMRPIAKTLAKVAPHTRMSTKSIAKWEAVCDNEELRQRLYDDPMYVWKYEVQALVGFLTYAPERPLVELRCPTLLVIGETDGMTPHDYTRKVFDLLQGPKELAVIPGAGHMGGLVEHRAEVLDVVDGWLGRQVAALDGDAAAGAGGQVGAAPAAN
jgi:alpha-beta hydrolase superfamily lysophospholipase